MIYKDLIVWQQAMDLVKLSYQVTSTFPDSERYGLITQIRRASVSVPCNIAEGALRKSLKEYVKFLYISLSSSAELETQILLCRSLVMGDQELLEEIELKNNSVMRLLRKLIQALETKLSS